MAIDWMNPSAVAENEALTRRVVEQQAEVEKANTSAIFSYNRWGDALREIDVLRAKIAAAEEWAGRVVADAEEIYLAIWPDGSAHDEDQIPAVEAIRALRERAERLEATLVLANEDRASFVERAVAWKERVDEAEAKYADQAEADDYWAGQSQQYISERDAALARERALREALEVMRCSSCGWPFGAEPPGKSTCDTCSKIRTALAD